MITEKDFITAIEQSKGINGSQSLMDYTRESHAILGHDERTAEELLNIYLNQNTPPNINV